uniref:dTDP-4-dehydrorhamnose 3,5-epimerase family protein n=1 Tax=Flavobacterium sp. TaxID=239 RepID=UPI00404708BA
CAGLYIPSGFAHGFQSLKDDSVIINACSVGYAPDYESGVLWDSCGIDWPLQNSILSDKDRAQPPFQAV